MITPLLNMALGVLVMLSAVYFDRTAISMLLVGLLLGPLVGLFSVMALVYERARYGATLAGVMLIVEALTMHPLLGSPTRAFDLVIGVAVIGISLVPHAQLANHHGERPEAEPTEH